MADGQQHQYSRHLAALVAFSLLAACTDTPSEPPPPPPPTASYDIDLRYVPGTDPPAEVRQRLKEAAARWERVIVGDLPAMQVTEPAPFECERVTAPPMDEEVDDLVVWIEIGPLDGPSGIGGWGDVCRTRTNHLPLVASILFDEEDFIGETLAAHEIGHAVGIGTVWLEMGLLVDPVSPSNGGAAGGLEPVADATIAAGSPDENFGVPGPSPLSTNLVAGKNLGDWTSGPADEELRALVRWNLSTLDPSAPITEARILLEESNTSVPMSGARLQIDFVRGAWEEEVVTWANKPPAEPSPLLGVTGEVQNWLAGIEPNEGVLLRLMDFQETEAYFGFHSRHTSDPALRPKLSILTDTHFIGPNAIEQFDALGGAAYPGPKVPLENDYYDEGEAVDAHWRSFHLSGELMGPKNFMSAPLSAVTVGALEDMGYEVDYSGADPFSVSNVP